MYDPHRLVRRFNALEPDVAAMIGWLSAKRYAADTPLDAYTARVLVGLMADIYRLVSREPYARTLPRPKAGAVLIHAEAVTILRAGEMAMDRFRDRRERDFEEYELECEERPKALPPVKTKYKASSNPYTGLSTLSPIPRIVPL